MEDEKMYSIAIVDDTQTDMLALKAFIEESPEFDRSTMTISTFNSGLNYLEEMKNNTDVVFIDMQMELMNGFETALELRKINTSAVLCFCSAVVSPQSEHFEVQPYRYILKNSDRDKIRQTVSEVLAEMKRCHQQKTVEIVTEGVSSRVLVNEILYIEKAKHGSRVVLSATSKLYKEGESLVCRQKLSELAEELAGEGFSSPHKSYLVNVRRIIKVANDEILMENESRISVTRSCRENFQHEISKFFSKKYGR